MNNCGTIYGITFQQLQEVIEKLVEIQGYYAKLTAMAPDEQQAAVLSQLFSEHAVNIGRLKQLYISLFCVEPVISMISIPEFTDYLEGLLKVRALEIHAFGAYVGVYFSSASIYYTAAITNIKGFLGATGAVSKNHTSSLQLLITQSLFQ